MRNPSRVLIWISLFLAIVVLICVLLAAPLRFAFMANPVFNGVIVAVILIGIVVNYRQVIVLAPEVRWIERFRLAGEDEPPPPLPRTRMLGAVARLLTGRHGDRFSLSAVSMRTLLDAIRTRLDESRDLSHYLVGILILLGLLGTLWGLLDTLQAVGDVLSGLSLGGQDAGTVFAQLTGGLQQPLNGMGTAFSSSLFGLSGALVLGFIDLQAGYAQNRFYNDLEDWLSGQTKLASGALTGEGDGSVPAYIQALLEQTADSLDRLQRIMARGEEDRRAADSRLLELTEQITDMVDQGRSEQKGLMGLTRTQTELQGVLERLADVMGSSDQHGREVRDHLRHMANALDEMRQEQTTERDRLLDGLREELRLLTRTVARYDDGRYGRGA